MNHNFELILWDLDGTLLNTKPGLKNSVALTAESIGFRKLTEDEIESFIGPPFEDRAREVFNLDDNKLKEVVEAFRDNYKHKELFNAIPIPHIYEALDEIKKRGIKQGLATYKIEYCTFPLIEHFDFTKYFDTMHGGLENEKLMKKDIMLKCIRDINITDMDKVLMVGDTEHDLRASIEIGCKFLGVKYGFGFSDLSEDEKKYKKILDFTDDISKIIEYL